MIQERTCYPYTESDHNRRNPACVTAYTRVLVGNDDPSERTRQIVQRAAECILRDTRERCRRSELIDSNKRMQGEVNEP